VVGADPMGRMASFCTVGIPASLAASMRSETELRFWVNDLSSNNETWPLLPARQRWPQGNFKSMHRASFCILGSDGMIPLLYYSNANSPRTLLYYNVPGIISLKKRKYFSPVCMAFLRVLPFPPTVQKTCRLGASAMLNSSSVYLNKCRSVATGGISQ